MSGYDIIVVTGEFAQQFGVMPPLDGRITVDADRVYDLTGWNFTDDGERPAGTYIGRRVHDTPTRES